jgi:hypothetical protein
VVAVSFSNVKTSCHLVSCPLIKDYHNNSQLLPPCWKKFPTFNYSPLDKKFLTLNLTPP